MSSPLHPSFNVCGMCGALVPSGNSDLHDAWHVKLHDHDKTVLAALDEALGALESISLLQDIDGERLADLEDR
jgi:hypothetical protein